MKLRILGLADAIFHPRRHWRLNQGLIAHLADNIKRGDYAAFNTMAKHCPTCGLLAVWARLRLRVV